jgi:nitroreductase
VRLRELDLPAQPGDEEQEQAMSSRLLTQQGAHTVLEAAVAAPSMHNTQPWRFRVTDDEAAAVEVHADAARSLPVGDPLGRALHVSCGAALLNLRVAAEHIGYGPRTVLLPDGDDASHLATVHLMPVSRGRGRLGALYGAVAQRRTNRGPFDGRAVPAGVAEEMARAAAEEGAQLRFLSGSEYERVVRLVHAADRLWSEDPRLVAERGAWVGGNRTGDGIPTGSLGPLPDDSHAVTRDLGAGAPDVAPASRGRARFETAPTLAVLETADDSPRTWLRAGMALEHALLVATTRGVSASFLNAPVERPADRWLVRDPSGPWAHAQMVLRLGYGAPPPATPRRRPVIDSVGP